MTDAFEEAILTLLRVQLRRCSTPTLRRLLEAEEAKDKDPDLIDGIKSILFERGAIADYQPVIRVGSN